MADALHGRVLRASQAASLLADPEHFSGGVRQHNLTAGQTEQQVLGVWFPAGARTILHKHPVDQLLHCFEGEIAVGIGTERRLLSPGELIVIPQDVWHWHGATPLGDAAHYSIKPHADTTWSGAPAAEQAEYDAYVDWPRWLAGVSR